MTNWQVLQLCGNGQFDHKADTREVAVRPCSSQTRGYSLLHLLWGSRVLQSILHWEQQYRCPAELVPWLWVLSIIEVNLQSPACMLPLGLLSSLLFLLRCGRHAHWLWLANQVRVRQALFRPPFLGPSPCGTSSAVPKEGCLATQSAAKCCFCLGSTNKWPIQPSRLHAELRLWFPVPSNACCFRLLSIAAGLFLPTCDKCLYSGHKLVRTSSTKAKGLSTVAQRAKMAVVTTKL